MSKNSLSGSRALHRLSTSYWLTLGFLTLINITILGITSTLAGVNIDAYIEGSREVAILNIVVLTALFWPAIALVIRQLHERRKWAWWGILLHAVTVFIFMEAFFSKPFGLGGGATVFNLVPTVLFMIVAAWLLVEFRQLRRQTPGSKATLIRA